MQSDPYARDVKTERVEGNARRRGGKQRKEARAGGDARLGRVFFVRREACGRAGEATGSCCPS